MAHQIGLLGAQCAVALALANLGDELADGLLRNRVAAGREALADELHDAVDAFRAALEGAGDLRCELAKNENCRISTRGPAEAKRALFRIGSRSLPSLSPWLRVFMH